MLLILVNTYLFLAGVQIILCGFYVDFLTCKVPPGFSTKYGKVDVGFSSIYDRVGFFQRPVCCLLCRHDHLTILIPLK